MLSIAAIRTAKPREKVYKLFDGGGLYLEVQPSGARWWRLKYRHAGKERRLSMGVFPDVPLAEARDRRDAARKLLRDGLDPSTERKAEKHRAKVAAANSFEAVAREWYQKKTAHLNGEHRERILRRFERDVFPYIGPRPIGALEAPDVLPVLQRIEKRGAIDSAHRARASCSQVFRYAVVTHRAKRDPTADLRGAIATRKRKNFAAVTEPAKVAELLRAIDGYAGTPETRAALRLAPLVFVRPGELRRAEWAEFDLDKAEWRLPAEKMKSKAAHIVPLSRQAVSILGEIRPLTGRWQFVFPSIRSRGRPMSENTINAALRRLGYTSDEMTGHGFRAMASTILHEQGWSSEVIERQLAHAERDETKAAYNRALHLPERRELMQAWADYLDELRTGANVVRMKKRRR